MSASGVWKVVIKTPLGDNDAVFDFVVEGSQLRGLLTGPLEASEVREGRVDGNKLTWWAQVTRPLSLRLDFSATVDGDALSGLAKGPFFTVAFAGRRG